MKEKTPLSHEVVCSDAQSIEIKIVENYFFFLENYVTSEGAVSHNGLILSTLHLLVTKLVFMLLAIILSNYQQYPVPVRSH